MAVTHASRELSLQVSNRSRRMNTSLPYDCTRKNKCRWSSSASRFAFTLVELLIAMAVTLIMMAALARAFAFVGERVRDGRGSVTLSAELRDVTSRLRNELEQCTVTLEPATLDYEPPGYFMYYEGPMTNASSSILGSQDTIDGFTVAVDSRYGDLDDYLAFTAVAKPGQWFQGQVPERVLTGSGTSTTPVMIRSKHAEIIYFLNAEIDSAGAILDANGNGLPDAVSLYRRVLLIRPDLNLTGGAVNLPAAGTAWQTGMAAAHQQCDLSVRRGLNNNGTYNNTIIANSLEDLSKPHNRFAHVRVPVGTLVGSGSNITSMPILSLDQPVELLLNADATSSLPVRPDSTSTDPTSLTSPVTDAVVLERRWSGFLRQEFVLAGDRTSEDVVVTNCRGFDIQILDPTATSILTSTPMLVSPNDVAYREAIHDASDSANGGFVDLAYPLLAGGSLRGWGEMKVTNNISNAGDAALSNATEFGFVKSAFAGTNVSPGAPTTFPLTAQINNYASSLLRSGKLVINSSNIVLFQPTFDTYTSHYERDGFFQDNRSGAGTTWRTSTPVAGEDLAADGLDNDGANGADDEDERETLPPFTIRPEAIKISIRLENPTTRQVMQSSVIKD
ncbi:type II secretion system protein J [Aporhodopirellula rubra]|uniref:type II secretion system protein J n=1 Tax=Aporhodopirellula rubra TaxID=980271 RepID=UPI0036F1B1DA